MLLQTKRLIIRELTTDDSQFFFELLNDKDWIRFIGDRNIQTLDDAKNYLEERIITSYKNWGFGFYLVIEKDTNISLGISGFVKRDQLEHPDVGFAFLPVGRNKGYALESTKALMQFGKEQLNFTTILAIANDDNKRSHKLLEKLGLYYLKQIKMDDEDDEICLFST